MNISGDHQRNFSKSVSLSRSMVLTQDTSIPSLLILGKLLTVSSDAAAPVMASSSLLRAKLLHKWEPSGTVNFWRVADEAFLVQFHEEADLARAMDGAPWSCDGGHLFLMQQAKPETNLVEQLVGDGFSKADLWVQFHNVPVEYFSAVTLNALAMRIGVPVGSPDLGAAPAGLLRARIRVDLTQPLVSSLPVDLDDGRTDLVVSVVYEQIPTCSLCASCGMIISSHPAAGHCAMGGPAAAGPTPPPTVVAASPSRSRREKEKPAPPAATASTNNVWIRLGSRKSSSMKQVHPPPVADADIDKDGSSSGSSSGATGSTTSPPPPPPPAADDDASAAAISTSRSLREKATVYVPSRLGSIRMSSSREQQQPLLGIDDENHSCQPCATASEGSTTTSEHLLVSATGTDERIVSVNRCLPFNSFNFLNLFSDKKKKELVGVSDNIANGRPNLQHSMQSSQRHQTQKTLLVTFSAPHHNTQESLVTDQNDTRPNASLALTTPSIIQLVGGYVNYYSCSGSRKNPRIEVEVKTQCPGELMKKAMEWLAQNTGLKASYDGNKGVINILGLQVDQRMGPVDLVASLYPRTRPKTGVAEAQEKPDSPARFQNMIIRLHDETCCKGCSGDKCRR